MSKKRYIDIGHQNLDGVFVWLLNQGRIEASPAAHGTHEQIWGQDGINNWRGRYYSNTNDCSVIAPVNWNKPGQIPSYVRDLVEARFGPVNWVSFNPDGSEM